MVTNSAFPKNACKFRLGQMVATPGAIEVLRRAGDDPATFIARHRAGDWGDVCEGDKKLNDDAVAHEDDPARRERVLSSYQTSANEKLWIITEADRSSTCVLTPSEY